MFDIGFWELSVIGVVALLVVGPDKLPGLARQAGRMAGRAQRMAGDLRREFEREAEFQELKKLRDEMRAGGDMEAAARRFQEELASMAKVDPTVPSTSAVEGSGASAAPGSESGAGPSVAPNQASSVGAAPSSSTQSASGPVGAESGSGADAVSTPEPAPTSPRGPSATPGA